MTLNSLHEICVEVWESQLTECLLTCSLEARGRTSLERNLLL